MLGQGVDRHLFCLYVVAHAIGVKSTFLERALSYKWGLSTSQTPTFQWDKAMELHKKVHILCPGGGFGPVDDNGYASSFL